MSPKYQRKSCVSSGGALSMSGKVEGGGGVERFAGLGLEADSDEEESNTSARTTL